MRQWTPPGAGNYNITFIADNNNSVFEHFDDNNEKSLLISVVTPPDLVVDGLTHSPSNPTVGHGMTFTATVTNNGVAPARAFIVEFRVQREGNSPTKFEQSVPGLNGTGSMPVEHKWTPTEEGSYNVIATADVANLVTESNEDNNQSATVAFVVCRPITCDGLCGNVSDSCGNRLDCTPCSTEVDGIESPRTVVLRWRVLDL